MQINLLAIGKFRSNEAEQALAIDYLRRAEVTGKQLGFSNIALQECEIKNKDNVKSRESDALLQNIGASDFLIVLDENGKDIKSRELAAIFEKQLQNGCKNLVFAIGGADGHSQKLKDRANFTLAFSKLTWPHKLCRVMAAEQIYRAVSILAKSPYHRD
jgi:23S rRNA (pseudouridine1915-N3)-methyltransferase